MRWVVSFPILNPDKPEIKLEKVGQKNNLWNPYQQGILEYLKKYFATNNTNFTDKALIRYSS